MEWKGYDTSHNSWVHRDVLQEDVPALLAAYDLNPVLFQARASAPKRATKGRQLPLPPSTARMVRAVPRVAPPLRRVLPPALSTPAPARVGGVRARAPPVRLRAGG